MAYEHGTFVWFALHTGDIAAAKTFYCEALGWKSSEVDMGGSKYTMLATDAGPQCGLVEPRDRTPDHWTSYLSVADVDATAKKARAQGGRILIPGTDIPGVGRFALVADPEGATFNLFKGETGDDDRSRAFAWNELWAKDAEKALPFYRAVLGAKDKAMPMGDMTYHVLEIDGKQTGGLMTSTIAEAPPMWLPYVGVTDCDATLERVRRLGGDVKSGPTDIPDVGRIAIFADPGGAVLGLLQPAAR